VRPDEAGEYHLDLPTPVDGQGMPVPLPAPVAGDGARLDFVRTAYGTAIHLVGHGPVSLRWQGAMPLRLSLDDARFSYRQFKFWAYAAEGSVPVRINVSLAEVNRTQGWEQHLQQGRTIQLDDHLQPGGWSLLYAVQQFDVLVQRGYQSEVARMALGALDVSLGAALLPLGMVVLRAHRRG
jgi:hypothetical protein